VLTTIVLKTMRRIELIEFLKGYSIFTIVIFHSFQLFHFHNIFGKLITFGGTGVHLFIFLSGFGLYLSQLNNPIPFIPFLKKRISKIYFPYIVVVLLSSLFSIFIPIYKNSLYSLGGHILLYKMFDESIIGSYGYPLWFISMIMQFYIVFFALIYFKEIFSNIKFLFICFLISILWSGLVIMLGKENERIWNSFFLQYLWEFGLGIVFASVYKQNGFKLKFKVKSIYLLIIGIINCALYAILALSCGSIGKMLNDFPALIGYSMIAIWVYKIENSVINTFFLFTGKISYSIYLLHMLILLIGLYFFKTLPIGLSICISLIFTYLFAQIYHKYTMYFFQKSGI